MQLRNGKTVTTSGATLPAIASLVPVAKQVPSFDQHDVDIIIAKFKQALSGPNETFMESMALYENVFTVFNENFDVIIQPRFNPTGRFLISARDRIAHWHAEVAQKFFNRLMENPEMATDACAQVKKTKEIISQTDKLLATIPL
jgi:hypothetical protein